MATTMLVISSMVSCKTVAVNRQLSCRHQLSRPNNVNCLIRRSQKNACQRNSGFACQAMFNFNKKPEPVDETPVDYTPEDVEDYFNYKGMLAVEGTYDRLDAYTAAGLEPKDILLLMAAEENDTPKVEELLKAGANVKVKDSSGKTPLELASADAVTQLLQAAV